MAEPVIKIENVSKQYRLGEIGTGSISHDINRWWHRARGKEDPYLTIGEVNDRSSKGISEYVWALKEVNFEVNAGEVLGIIGRNGAGKSTLLKLLSRTTTPTQGRIRIHGRVASLLEVGTGFHPELSGRDNIFLNGAILGMNKKEIRSKLDEIIQFSGVERYIDTPVKRYSSGMYVRLAFAVAAHLEPDILIVDEVLAVGDAEFQKKCLGKMKDVSVNDGRTVIFVSHDLNAVSQLCTRGLLLSNGMTRFEGNVNEMIGHYLSGEIRLAEYFRETALLTDKQMAIQSIQVLNQSGDLSNKFNFDESIVIDFKLFIKEPLPNVSFFVTILDVKKRRVFSCEKMEVGEQMKLTIDAHTLVRGSYSIHAFINWPRVKKIDEVEDVCYFQVIDTGSQMAKHGEYDYGVVFGRYQWTN